MGVRSDLWSCFDVAETTYWSNLEIDDEESSLNLVRQAWYHHQRYAPYISDAVFSSENNDDITEVLSQEEKDSEYQNDDVESEQEDEKIY